MQALTPFNQQPWNQRFQKLGDEAEAIFENVAAANGWPWERTGLNRPSLDMTKLSAETRYTPDYLCEFGYVEVQGFGQEGIAKFKKEKLSALLTWNDMINEVHLFLWDNVNRKYTVVTLEDVIGTEPTRQGEFPEGKKWVGYSPDTIGGWKDYKYRGTITS